MRRLLVAAVLIAAVVGWSVNTPSTTEVAEPAAEAPGELDTLGPVTLIAAQYGSNVARDCGSGPISGGSSGSVSPGTVGLVGTVVSVNVVFGPKYEEDPGGVVSGTLTGGGAIRIDAREATGATCSPGDLVMTFTGTIDNNGTIDTFTFDVVAS